MAREAADGALFGTRPLSRRITGVQRAGAPGGQSLATTAAGGSATPVRVMRDGAAAGTAAQLKAKAFTHAGDVYLPAHHGPLDSGPARSLLAHELTHVQQQRDLGASLPAEHTAEGQRLERAAQTAEATGSLPLNLRLATPAAARPNRSPTVAQRTSATPAAVEGDEQERATISVAGTTGMSPGMAAAPVQRVEEVSSAAAPAPGPSSRGVATDQQELEELATKLWERLRFRMRRELLHDRERAGMVADLS